MKQENRIMSVEMKITKISEKLDMHCEQQKIDISTLYSKLDSKASKSDTNEIKGMLKEALEGKAGKWVENWTYGIIFIIVGSAIGFLIWIVQKGVI